VGVETEVEEVEEVVEVDLPDPLGVEGDREEGAGELAGDAEVAGEALVVGVGDLVAAARSARAPARCISELRGVDSRPCLLVVRLQGDRPRGRARRTSSGASV
jgi:hypothetical protein